MNAPTLAASPPVCRRWVECEFLHATQIRVHVSSTHWHLILDRTFSSPNHAEGLARSTSVPSGCFSVSKKRSSVPARVQSAEASVLSSVGPAGSDMRRCERATGLTKESTRATNTGVDLSCQNVPCVRVSSIVDENATHRLLAWHTSSPPMEQSAPMLGNRHVHCPCGEGTSMVPR